MVLKVVDNGRFMMFQFVRRRILCRPTRHSPQRPQDGSIGLVVEPKRASDHRDGFEWYCFDMQYACSRIEVTLKSIVKDLPPLSTNNFIRA